MKLNEVNARRYANYGDERFKDLLQQRKKWRLYRQKPFNSQLDELSFIAMGEKRERV